MKAETFEKIKEVVHSVSGLSLDESKKYLIKARILPLAEKQGITTMDEFLPWLMENHDKWEHLLSHSLATHETYFFREPDFFTDLKDIILTRLKTKETIRIWSAACSTGQEAYSVAMQWLESGLPQYHSNVTIIGTDFVPTVLEKARIGRYTQYEVQRGLPILLLLKYFKQVEQGWEVKDVLKNLVSFEENNLLNNKPHLTNFDIILLRNILIYFSVEDKIKVLKDIKSRLAPGGIIALGATETVYGLTNEFKKVTGVKTSVYELA
jgi:chemotaxis protein methyltransferase CheR